METVVPVAFSFPLVFFELPYGFEDTALQFDGLLCKPLVDGTFKLEDHLVSWSIVVIFLNQVLYEFFLTLENHHL